METDLNFFEEVHLKDGFTEKKISRNYSSSFKKGILIGGVSIAAMLAIVGFQSSNNGYSYEEAALHLDSIQIQQNNRIIELLETKAVRDTTIIHVIAPAL